MQSVLLLARKWWTGSGYDVLVRNRGKVPHVRRANPVSLLCPLLSQCLLLIVADCVYTLVRGTLDLVVGLRRDCYLAGSCIGLLYRPVLDVSATPPRRASIQRREMSNRSCIPPNFIAVERSRDSEHIHPNKASRCYAAFFWWTYFSAELSCGRMECFSTHAIQSKLIVR